MGEITAAFDLLMTDREARQTLHHKVNGSNPSIAKVQSAVRTQLKRLGCRASIETKLIYKVALMLNTALMVGDDNKPEPEIDFSLKHRKSIAKARADGGQKSSWGTYMYHLILGCGVASKDIREAVLSVSASDRHVKNVITEHCDRLLEGDRSNSYAEYLELVDILITHYKRKEEVESKADKKSGWKQDTFDLLLADKEASRAIRGAVLYTLTSDSPISHVREVVTRHCARLLNSGSTYSTYVDYLELVDMLTNHYSKEATQINENKEDKEMSTSIGNIDITIDGVVSSEVSDEEIFDKIKNLEGQIESLLKIKTKSTKLTASMNLISLKIKALVELVDTRD